MTARVPLVVAHRTCPNHAPENSLEGIARAAELGADAVELDVRLTRDAQPVLLHDRTLRRMTRNLAPVWALSLPEVRRLRLPNEEPVPTFAAALDALPAGLRVAIHVKVPRAVHPVLDEIRNQGAGSKVWIWSEHGSVVRFTADRHPEIETALLRPGWVGSGGASIRAARRSGARGIGTYWSSVTADLAARIGAAGLQLTSWCRTRDIDPDKARLLDALVSDWPDDARATMRRVAETGDTS